MAARSGPSSRQGRRVIRGGRSATRRVAAILEQKLAGRSIQRSCQAPAASDSDWLYVKPPLTLQGYCLVQYTMRLPISRWVMRLVVQYVPLASRSKSSSLRSMSKSIVREDLLPACPATGSLARICQWWFNIERIGSYCKWVAS